MVTRGRLELPIFGLKGRRVSQFHYRAIYGDRYRIRTGVTAVKGRCLRPLDQPTI